MTRAQRLTALARPWPLAVAYLVSVVAVLAQLALLRYPSAVPFYLVAISSAPVVQLVGFAMSLRVARHPRLSRPERRSWRFMTVAFGALAVFTIAILATVGANGAPKVASAALIVSVGFRIVLAAALCAGLTSFPAPPMTSGARWRLVMHLTTVTGGLLMLVWFFLIGPLLTGHGLRMDGTATLYPVGDLAVALAVCTAVLRGAVTPGYRSVLMLRAGVALYVVSSMLVTYSLLEDNFGGMWFNGFIMTAALLLMTTAAGKRCREADLAPRDDGACADGAAPADRADGAAPVDRADGAAPAGADPAGAAPAGRAGETGTGAVDAPAGRMIRPNTWLPYAVLFGGYCMLGLVAARSEIFPWAGLVGGAAIMTLGVTASLIIALAENSSLLVTDPLTGLLSRGKFDDDLDHVERLGARNQRCLRPPNAALLIDINAFKQINDTFGHRGGDAVLTAVTAAIRAAIRSDDVAARYGGDEFAVLLGDITDPHEAITVAERILDRLRKPLTIADQRIPVHASIGIAVNDGTDAAMTIREQLHRADLAMYLAKRTRTTGWQMYTDAAMAAERDTAALREDLVRATSAGQLLLMYQPIVAIDTGEQVGVEALVRWQHPTRGMISPMTFIPLAEQSGVITEIGAWVLETACRQVGSWFERLPAGRTMQLNVNVAAQQLESSTLAADVLAVLAATGMPPEHLVIEVTESALVNEQAAVPQLQILRERGIRVALDDFGTGYSSLRYLTHLPVDILKLDRCFVAELDGSREKAVVAEAVIGLGNILHLDAVVEGIETAEQAAALARMGYRKAQGYRYAKPVPAETIDRCIASGCLTWPDAGDSGRGVRVDASIDHAGQTPSR